jgi:hypothetical protein
MISVRHASDARAQREEDSISDDEAASVIISARLGKLPITVSGDLASSLGAPNTLHGEVVEAAARRLLGRVEEATGLARPQQHRGHPPDLRPPHPLDPGEFRGASRAEILDVIEDEMAYDDGGWTEDDDTGYGPYSYFAHAMAKDD